MLRTSRSSIGFDVDGRNINAVQLLRSRKHVQIEAAASVPRADSTLPLEQEELHHITDILHRQGFRGRDVILALPNEAVMSSILKVPANGADADLPDLVRTELASAHHCQPSAIETAVWTLPAQGETTARHVMAVACRSELANAAIDMFQGANLSVRAIDVRPCALARACAPLLEDSQGLVAILSVGWSCTELALVCDGVLVFERTLVDSSLNLLHTSLRNTYDIDPEVTDGLIAEVGCGATSPGGNERTDFANAVYVQIVEFANRLLVELTASISFATQEYTKSQVDRLFVTGEGAALPGLVQRVSTELQVEGRSVAPADIAPLAPGMKSRGRSTLLTAAVGLALHPDG